METKFGLSHFHCVGFEFCFTEKQFPIAIVVKSPKKYFSVRYLRFEKAVLKIHSFHFLNKFTEI